MIASGAENLNSLKDVIENDAWAGAEGVNNGLPVIIRFRNKIEQGRHTNEHPQLLQVYWEFDKHSNGMPSRDVMQEMTIFEDRISEALEKDLSGVLVAAITTNGYREWVFYAKSLDSFAEQLHNMPQNSEPYPIKIETMIDTEWKYFFDSVRPEN